MSIDSQKITAFAKKSPALTIAALLICALLVVLYLRYDKLAVFGAQLSESQNDLAKLQRNIVNAAQLDRQLEEIKQINEKISGELLRPSELARNLQFFYTLESDTGVKLLDLQQQPINAPARGAAPSVFTQLRFTVNVAGSYEQLLKFMREVETTFIGGKILSATMSPGAAQAGENPEKARLLSMVVQTIAINK